MIKTSVIFSAHAIHGLIRNTLIFFLVLFIVLFAWLRVGIHIEKLEVSKYLIEGLYIKLDKKLTLKATKLIIPKAKEKPALNQIDDTFEMIKYLLTFFQQIELEKIHFDNNTIGINYYNNILQLSSQEYLIRGNIHREGNLLIARVPMLQLKKHGVLIQGEFTYDLQKDMLITEGKFLVHETTGFFRVSKKKNKIDFSLSSNAFTDLRFFVDKLTISKKLKPWIVDHIQAKNYQLISFSGKGDIVNNAFKIDTPSLKAEALLKDVSIVFKKDIAPVLSPSIMLHYSHNNGLRFDLENPRYLGKDLNGSSVSIRHLHEKNTTLHLNLKFHTRFDDAIVSLLKAYEISVPVIQEKGKIRGTLDAKIALKKHQNNFRFSGSFSKSNVRVSGIPFSINKGKISYVNKVLYLKDILLKHPMYHGILNGKIHLDKKRASFVFDAKKVILKNKNNVVLTLKNETIPFFLSYKNHFSMTAPKYTLALKHTSKKTTLTIKSLEKIKGFVSNTLPIEEGGNIEITTADFKTFHFSGMLQRDQCFLYKKNNKCETHIPIKGKISQDNINLYAFNKQLHYASKRKRININTLNIDLKKFLQHKHMQSKKSINKATNLVIVGKNSHLRYDKYQLLTDSYDIEIKKNGDIQAMGNAKGDIIKFSKEKDVISLKALRIKDKILHPLIHFDGLQNGRYTLIKKGNPSKVMKGEIILEGGVMKDFTAYNNTLAFINTIPALAMLHKPGYSNDGFPIDSGIIEYRMIHGSKIIFDSIYIKGVSATIVGKGEIDLAQNKIHIKLGILVARELGKAVSKIPLIGYILVGKDQSITVGLEITGSLNEPKISVSAAKDILSYPLELIKRTIEAPQNLLLRKK